MGGDTGKRVTIGLPVRNGENYLGEALDSITAQTHENLLVIISDNASTDRTEDICRNYADSDPRIVYHRLEENIGGANNFNRVFNLSNSPYFKWACHDDVIAPNFLESCLAVLEEEPSVVLCASRTDRIDDEGRVTGTYEHRMRLGSDKPHVRFGDLLDMDHPVWPIFGVFRSEVLAKTPLIASYVGSDRNLLAEVGLRGRIHELAEPLFFRRDHPGASTRVFRKHSNGLKKHDERLEWFDPSSSVKVLLPYWRRCREYRASVVRTPLPWAEKIRCYLAIGSWLRKEGLRLMASDLERRFLRTTEPGRRIADLFKLLMRHTLVHQEVSL